MKINNVDLEYFISYFDRRIHLLDLENYGNRLLDTISPEWMKQLVYHEHLMMDVLEFEWICYTSSGLVLIYKNYSLNILSSNLPYLHKPFLKALETKKKQHGH